MLRPNYNPHSNMHHKALEEHGLSFSDPVCPYHDRNALFFWKDGQAEQKKSDKRQLDLLHSSVAFLTLENKRLKTELGILKLKTISWPDSIDFLSEENKQLKDQNERLLETVKDLQAWHDSHL